MKTKMPLYESPSKAINEAKYGCENVCICCGKPLKKGHSLFVHINDNMEVVNPTIDEDECFELTGSESQGCFPVGNDCAKKMIGFTFLN